jgi:hypothetical protein
MFQSFKFKQNLGLSFAANIEILTIERSTHENNLGSIGVQILTIDEISLMILQQPALRYNMVRTFVNLINNLVNNNFEAKDASSMFHFLYDLKYMTRPKTVHYAINQTDFIENLLE